MMFASQDSRKWGQRGTVTRRLMSGCGPTLPTLAMQQLGGHLGQTGRDADVGVKAYIDRKNCGDFMIS